MEQSPIWRHRLVQEAGVCTLVLAGELDLACSANLQGLLFEQTQADGVAELRVDLSEVEFLDSTVLGVLVSALQYAEDQGRCFAVVEPSPAAQRILAITGLDTILVRP